MIEDYSDEIMEEETAEARIAAVFAALDAELEKADESSSDTKIEERLFAISLRNKEEKIEPTAPVSLTFSGIDTESTAEVKVYQIDADDNTVKDMDAGVNDNGDIELVADDLSLQAVTMTTGISPLQETDPNRHNTTDSRADGITINLFDYWLNTSSDNGTNNGNIGINAGKIFKFISSRTSGSGAWNAWTQGAITYPNILNRTLGTDGYPILNSTVTGNTQSLAYLFDEFDADDIRDSVQAWKRAYLNVNHLLEKTGDYYKFDSQHNFAYYDVSQGDGGDFYVHKDTYSVPDSGGTTVPVGFFPFNEYNSVQSSNNNLGYGNYYDHLFGLSLEADFLLSPTAKDSNGEDLIFTFSGDDDAWVFIDDVLVMDVGGIHDKMGGSINFATGVVKVDGRADTTIAQRFSEAGRTWTRSATEYTEHTIKFYYFERGANQSNLKMDFNIPTFTKQDLEISKNISGEGSEIDPNTEYRFQLELSQGYQKNDEFTTYTGPAEYDDGTQVSFDGDGSFSLKAGQTIIIKDIIDLKYYKLKELDFDSDAFSYVLFNGEAILPDGDNNVSAPATQARGNLVVDFENVIAEDPVDIVVKKLWSDGNINHTTDEITFQLLDANNSPITVYGENTFTLSAANNWTIKFTDIPAIFADLSTVEEIDVPDGYEVSYDKRISEDDDVTIIITNREEPVPGTISVSKKWYQQDGTLLEGPPENDVQVQLMQKGTVEDSGSGSGEEHTVTFRLKVRGDGWSVVYLPIGTKTVPHGESLQFAFGYNLWGTQWNESYAYPEAGNRVNDAVGTHTFGSGLTANVYEVTNVTQNTTIDLITWWYGTSDPGIRDDFLEDKINNLQTFYDPETYPPSTGDGGTTIEVQAYGQPITLNEANNWQGKWGNLPATDDNGNPYSYFIEEVTIGGEPAGFTDYEIDYVNNDGIEYGHITVKNTAPVNYGYELPETGGRGISAYLIGGIFLMALIPFYKYIDHKKRKRYES